MPNGITEGSWIGKMAELSKTPIRLWSFVIALVVLMAGYHWLIQGGNRRATEQRFDQVAVELAKLQQAVKDLHPTH